VSRDCMLRLLASSTLPTWQVALLRGVDHVVDTQATLFLNVGSALSSGQLVRSANGLYVHMPTNTTPCVLHFNGHHAAKVRLRELSQEIAARGHRSSPWPWVVRPSLIRKIKTT
jgi:hypothetical protein